MFNFKKYLVVPFVSSIEKPSENFIENADKTMSDAIMDTKMPDDLKLKIYHQNLNQFLLKYDPNTFGVTPMLAKLAQTVTEFIDKKKENGEPFQAQIKQEVTDSPLFKSQLTTPTSILKNRFNDTYFYKKENAYDMDNNNYKLGPDYSINTTHTEENQSNLEKTQKNEESLLNNYEKGSEPYQNTRNLKEATHSYGTYGDYNPEANPTIRSTKTSRSPVKASTIKNQKTVESKKPAKNNQKLETGHGKGAEWTTKRFF